MLESVIIIGYGVVGQNLHRELKNLNPDIKDKYKPEVNNFGRSNYNFGFICVDTPLINDKLDITEVKNAILETNCDIYIIKSTIPVGTITNLIKETGKHIVFSPEYYGGTQHCNNYKYDFTILGGDKKDCNKVVDILNKCYDGRHTFRIVEPELAELAKFMENSWIATKVSFCTEFNTICNKLGLNYNELRELFILDPRVSPSHTFVYKDTPYWDSHCLNKDVVAVANQFDMDLLKQVVRYNNDQKSKGDISNG